MLDLHLRRVPRHGARVAQEPVACLGGQSVIGKRQQSQSDLRLGADEWPRFDLAPRGLGPKIAFRVVHGELLLDDMPRMNLATFVSTCMDPKAGTLMLECVSKN